jgi:hypothetical protein
MWEWLSQWKLERHAYIRLGQGGPLRYKQLIIEGKKVWYEILVPYQVEFETEPVDGQTVWENVSLTNQWPNRDRQVNDQDTGEFIARLNLLEVFN